MKDFFAGSVSGSGQQWLGDSVWFLFFYYVICVKYLLILLMINFYKEISLIIFSVISLFSYSFFIYDVRIRYNSGIGSVLLSIFFLFFLLINIIVRKMWVFVWQVHAYILINQMQEKKVPKFFKVRHRCWIVVEPPSVSLFSLNLSSPSCLAGFICSHFFLHYLNPTLIFSQSTRFFSIFPFFFYSLFFRYPLIRFIQW